MHLLIHVFLDNARYYYTKFVWEWLARPGRRIKLHFIPPYCPHPNPIERLWGLMHRNATHRNATRSKCYPHADNSRPPRTISCVASPQELGKLSRFGHGQFPRHQPTGLFGF
jgi:transposase